MKQQERAMGATFGVANQSRWFDDYRELPFILDGGCHQIEVVYDSHSEQVESVECNGSV